MVGESIGRICLSILEIGVIAFASSGIGTLIKDREVSFRRNLDERIRRPVPFLCGDVIDR